MKNFLLYITQLSLLRIILYITLGLAMWVISFLYTDRIDLVLVTCGFTIINSLLFSYMLCKMGASNLPSSFAACSYWLLMSAWPNFHTYWQGQIWVLGMICILLLATQLGYQREAVEEVFVASLLASALSLVIPTACIGIFLLWIVILLRKSLTIRLLLASLIGISIVLFYTCMAIRLGWINYSWSIFVNGWDSRASWLMILSVGGYLFTYLPLRNHSIVAGLSYFIFCIVIIAAGICCLFI